MKSVIKRSIFSFGLSTAFQVYFTPLRQLANQAPTGKPLHHLSNLSLPHMYDIRYGNPENFDDLKFKPMYDYFG